RQLVRIIERKGLPIRVVRGIIVLVFCKAVATLDQHDGGAHQSALQVKLVLDIGWLLRHGEGELSGGVVPLAVLFVLEPFLKMFLAIGRETGNRSCQRQRHRERQYLPYSESLCHSPTPRLLIFPRRKRTLENVGGGLIAAGGLTSSADLSLLWLDAASNLFLRVSARLN